MSSLYMVNSLTGVFVTMGVLGAIVAVVCAAVAGVALAIRADGTCGGAAGVWIVGMMLSLTACFASMWVAPIVAAASLAIALVVGAVVRGILHTRTTRQAAF